MKLTLAFVLCIFCSLRQMNPPTHYVPPARVSRQLFNGTARGGESVDHSLCMSLMRNEILDNKKLREENKELKERVSSLRRRKNKMERKNRRLALQMITQEAFSEGSSNDCQIAVRIVNVVGMSSNGMRRCEIGTAIGMHTGGHTVNRVLKKLRSGGLFYAPILYKKKGKFPYKLDEDTIHFLKHIDDSDEIQYEADSE